MACESTNCEYLDFVYEKSVYLSGFWSRMKLYDIGCIELSLIRTNLLNKAIDRGVGDTDTMDKLLFSLVVN